LGPRKIPISCPKNSRRFWLEEYRATQKSETTVQEEQEDAISLGSDCRDNNLKKEGNSVAPRSLCLLFRRSYSISANCRKNQYKRGEKFNEVKRRTTFFCCRVQSFVIRIGSFKIKYSVLSKALQFINYTGPQKKWFVLEY